MWSPDTRAKAVSIMDSDSPKKFDHLIAIFLVSGTAAQTIILNIFDISSVMQILLTKLAADY
jgi:hypothetical protein